MSTAELKAERIKLKSQLRTKPNSSFLHNQLAVCELAMGNKAGFVKEMKLAIKLDPRNAFNYFELSEVYGQWKQLITADSYLVKAAKIDSSNPVLRMKMGEMYERRRDTKNARVEYLEAKKLLNSLQGGSGWSNSGRVEKGIYYDARGNAYTGVSSLELSVDQHLTP